jgi:hypothetical protein
MKKLVLVLSLVLGTSVNAQTKGVENPSKGFDFDLFQKTLTEQMLIQFPGMVEDTTNNFAARATSQEEAGYPICYGSKRGGMVNLKENEIDQAKRLVSEYKQYLFDSPYFGETTIKKYYVDFSAVATKQYGGLIRYGFIVDNNITYESIMGESKIIEDFLEKN